MSQKQGFITVGVDYGAGEGQAHMMEIDYQACEAMMHLFRVDEEWMMRKLCEVAGHAYVRSRKSAGRMDGGEAGAAQQPGPRQH